MLRHIRDSEGLTANGLSERDRRARRACVEALESALGAADPQLLMRSSLRVARDRMTVLEKTFDLSSFRRIVVLGGGKAAGEMAVAAEKLLGRRISAGMVNVPESEVTRLQTRIVRLNAAAHPLPSQEGENGVRAMLDLVEPSADTLVIFLLSGGGSALLPLPREGVRLQDKIDVTKRLLRAGASIQELNVVRKHLSGLKGGWLAARLHPCTTLSIIISDVVGDGLDSIASGPLTPDPSTFRDAKAVLERYNLWKTVPKSVSELIDAGIERKTPETPKPGSEYFANVYSFIIGNGETACQAAAGRLRTLGYRPQILTIGCDGEASQAGRLLGAIAAYQSAKRNKVAYVLGGETTVAVKGRGIGGRNQEFVLASALKIDGNTGVAIASLGTDGVDGPTDAAGAICDGSTVKRAKERGQLAERFLFRNDSYTFFEKRRDLIVTGPTGTNVNDVAVAVVDG